MSPSTPVGPWRMLRETIPIAVILSLWKIVAVAFSNGGSAGALHLAGFAMVGLFVVVRGVAIGTQHRSEPVSADLADTVRENLWILVVAGGWFLLVQALYWGLLVAPVVRGLGEEPLARWVADVLNWTGVGTVLLYAVIAASSRLPTVTADGETGVDGDDPSSSGED